MVVNNFRAGTTMRIMVFMISEQTIGAGCKLVLLKRMYRTLWMMIWGHWFAGFGVFISSLPVRWGSTEYGDKGTMDALMYDTSHRA